MSKQTKVVKPSGTDEQITKLERQLEDARNKELRAQADYQNLVRRSQQERAAFVKMAARDLVESLLQPLSHLELAAAQLKDAGLDMVVQQFKTTLAQQGLEEIEVMGKPFDIETMEVVETATPALENQHQAKVIAVHTKGYRLNGQVIQHAKVVMGEKND